MGGILLEVLESLYKELSDYNPMRFTISTTSIQKMFASLFENTDNNYWDEDFLSKEDEYLEGAKKLKGIDLDIREITGTEKTYIYGYQDLTFDEFLSYLSWRTLIRKRKEVPVPGGFLALYLIEIVNYVEVETVFEAVEIMNFLEALSAGIASNLSQIKKARKEFLFLYGTLAEAKSITDYSAEYQYILDDDNITQRKMCLLLNHLSKRHYSAFLKSKMYLENAERLEEDFFNWFYCVSDYFLKKKINLLELYCGERIYGTMRKVYVKKIRHENVVRKDIDFCGIPVIRVAEDVNLITKYYTDGTTKNQEHLYVEGVVMRYILRLYECRKRKELKYPKTYPSMSEVTKGFYNLSTSQRIIEILDSTEFNQIFCS